MRVGILAIWLEAEKNAFWLKTQKSLAKSQVNRGEFLAVFTISKNFSRFWQDSMGKGTIA
jgi:hypothetical protein